MSQFGLFCHRIFLKLTATLQFIKQQRDNSMVTHYCNTVIINVRKINVKLSLCLTKYHTMKTHPVLNQAPCHEDVLWNGVIAPRILNLGRIGVLGFDSRRGLEIFFFTTAFRTALQPTQLPTQWVLGALSLGVKRPRREADHSPPSSAEVKE
jgi:hypothetical protein